VLLRIDPHAPPSPGQRGRANDGLGVAHEAQDEVKQIVGKGADPIDISSRGRHGHGNRRGRAARAEASTVALARTPILHRRRD